MGLSPFKNTFSTFDKPKQDNPNPDPSRFNIIKIWSVNGYTILKLKYHGCTNYEGIKILVFDAPVMEVYKQPLIDPHFSLNKEYHSPIARFLPTEEGWQMAMTFCNSMPKGTNQ